MFIVDPLKYLLIRSENKNWNTDGMSYEAEGGIRRLVYVGQSVRHAGVHVVQGKLLRQRSYGKLLGSLKNELIHHQRYATGADAETAIKEYIEIFYNCQRRQSRLAYVSPAQFAENIRKTTLAA